MRQVLLSVFLLLAPLRAGADTEALGLALDALAQRDLGLAAQAAGRIDDPVALDILSWTRLRQGQGDWQEFIDFLDRNPDWPGLPYLRAQGEPSIPAGADPAAVIAYFADQSPTTGTGALALALALQARGDQAAAEAEAIRAWTGLTMTGDEAGRLRTAFGAVLNQGTHHVDRLDHLLWEGAEERARAMFPLVPEGWQRLAEARLALRARRPGVDDLIAAVPADLAGHPGLAYERFLWRMRSGFWDTAGELMAERSASRATLGRPLAWADRRADLARDVMREGDFETCYAYAANHHVDPAREDSSFSENEWIAGYCAFRLGRHADAVRHFETFRGSVTSPISMGRAGYWLGRAHEAAGYRAAAAEAYALGARYQSSFYGQLAAERGGLPVDPAFLGTEVYGDWRQAAFTRSTVFHAALLYYEAGQDWPAERFLTHLTESLTRTEAGQMGDFALELGDIHLALRIAKRAAQSGHEIMRAYYPIAPELVAAQLPAPAALVLSIARRESEFDPGVVSPAGAIGLMQVMPATGRDTARDIGIAYSQDRLLDDPAYNAQIGAHFLAGLIERYRGNPVLVTIAYNAGPGRANEWIERFGDPRQADDIVYWIEALPFTETRNYVMRVTESLAIYEAQLTGSLPTLGLSERLVQ
ncbi:lytic transglycosylase domain-containing protein [Roseicyclus persicicus]|uniref:Lytic transglycosylase domain-containing protein n=1 Tax=Roseicyclus persicicus TaxID=2650661 RepID=A0A7X6H226_9RHOB|nr:lytic transglycosylase domain-containing protein [Roseibacterium persicicum]NKX45322.1 lytic transglycosylase domain-containing protein [Roseibacterium persicicum]